MFSYVRDAYKFRNKVYQADYYRKNNTCISCVFNGFKYIYYSQGSLKSFFLSSMLLVESTFNGFCAGWSELSLLAFTISTKITCTGSKAKKWEGIVVKLKNTNVFLF